MRDYPPDPRGARVGVGLYGVGCCDGLLDQPRPGAPRTVSDEDVERVVTRTLETLPRGATQWSTRTMAKECRLSFATVGRI